MDYFYDKKWENIDWEKVKDAVPIPLQDEKPKSEYELRGKIENLCCTVEEAQAIVNAGIPINIKPMSGTQITKMQDRKQWDSNPVVPSDLMNGSAVQIAIADVGLLLIDQVKHIDDACTDMLQDMLDSGWRILAVCPPNSARRPDYILGRRKSNA